MVCGVFFNFQFKVVADYTICSVCAHARSDRVCVLFPPVTILITLIGSPDSFCVSILISAGPSLLSEAENLLLIGSRWRQKILVRFGDFRSCFIGANL